MRRALDEFYVRGVSHNVPFLAALMAHPRFRAGNLTTNFIAEEFKGGFTAAHLPPRDPAVLAGVAAVVDRIQAQRAAAGSGKMPGHAALVQDNCVVMLNRQPVALSVSGSGSDFAVEVSGRRIGIETNWSPGEPLFHAKVDEQVTVVQIDAIGSGWRLILEGGQADVLVLTPRQAELYALMPVKAAPDTSKFLLSPMPGLLASVAVSEGQEIKAGEALAVVEAMKMENVLRAARDGTVKTLHAKAGDSLRVDQKIIEFA
jgi:propionyl-CoA carboxylase alpha chain